MEYDVVIVGSGPNGLAAAIKLQQAGLSTCLIEGQDTVGGGMRTRELTLPGYHHDVCSAIHPMAAASPFFRSLPLGKHGLEFVFPEVCAAHPLDGGRAGVLWRSYGTTTAGLGADSSAYEKLIAGVVRDWPNIVDDVMGPVGIPAHPLPYMRFGLNAILRADDIARRFKTSEARALWAGMAAHSVLSFNQLSSAAIGIVLTSVGHVHGWPLAKGGSQSIANALATCYQSLGGKITTGWYVNSLKELPSSRAVVLDVTPRQLLAIAGYKLSSTYKWQLNRYRYGPGIFKIDWALDGPVPFTSEACRRAGTVHLGNTYEEVARAEWLTSQGKIADKPFVLFVQQSLFDGTRAPNGKHTGWAYCHVPNGSTVDMTKAIEDQVERFAPGFRDLILARHVYNTADLEAYNANYIGGDIGGGAIDVGQLLTRPVLRASPYRTSAKGVYLCSASTPPGGGVHGMGGYGAATAVLADVFARNTGL